MLRRIDQQRLRGNGSHRAIELVLVAGSGGHLCRHDARHESRAPVSVRRGIHEAPIELAQRSLAAHVDYGAGFEEAEVEIVWTLADRREAFLPDELVNDLGPERAVADRGSAAAH